MSEKIIILAGRLKNLSYVLQSTHNTYAVNEIEEIVNELLLGNDISEFLNNLDVVAEEVENGKFANYHEEDVYEVVTKGLSTRLKAGNLPIEKELTWGDLLLKFNWQKIKEGNTELELSDFINWLRENYNVPTPKN
jgi:hypothetical protein